MEQNEQIADPHGTIQENILIEQVKILHKNLLLSIPANFLCAIVVFIELLSAKSRILVWTWFICVALLSIFRLTAYYFYSFSKDHIFYLKIFILGVIFSSVLWGLAGSLLMPAENLLQQMVVIVIIAGVSAGGMQTLNANLTSGLLYIFLIVAPLCVWLFLQDNFEHFILGLAMTTYLFFMLFTTIRGYRLLTNTLVLQYENLELINNLSISNQKLSQSYRALELEEREVSLINQMNGRLQTCYTTEEAYSNVFLSAKELFKDFSGCLAILGSVPNQLEVIHQWGNTDIMKMTFDSNDCWALRQGHAYLVEHPSKSLVCYHFTLTPSAYVCLPLIFQNNIMALLVLHSPSENILKKYKPHLATSFCEVIQIALTNIKLRETLYEQAIRDPLTGLFNRRYLDEILEHELQRIMREKKSLCVAMLDLDHFKDFNDNNGHDAGDEVLRVVGSILNETFRKVDIACRFGGEEFLIILVNADLSNADLRLNEVRQKNSGNANVF